MPCRSDDTRSWRRSLAPFGALAGQRHREESETMDKRILSWTDRKRLRDEAIVDFRHGFINRREFMLRATAAGVYAAFASEIANAVEAPPPPPERSRWAKQADTTITIIKGPHHPDDAKFWDAMK